MNVVVRETGPPCASKLPVKIKHIEILRRITMNEQIPKNIQTFL